MTDTELAVQLAFYRMGSPGGRPFHPPICDVAAERIVALRADLLQSYLEKQRVWSRVTFGYGDRAEGICKHIEKELAEIRRAPGDLVEWIDVIILALDGYWRAGGDPAHIMNLLRMKQAENFAREWPAPGSVPEGEPTEHVRCQHYNLTPAGVCVECGKSLVFLESEPTEHVRIRQLEPMEINPDAVSVRCAHDHLNMDGICHACGADRRGI